jgi:hypothetical protein
MTKPETLQRAIDALVAQGRDPEDARRLFASLDGAGIGLADDRIDELVCRWIDVGARPVPPEADTIIRTITRTVDGVSRTTTHWLEGLRSPRESR